jgi:hypothetical protein
MEKAPKSKRKMKKMIRELREFTKNNTSITPLLYPPKKYYKI